MITPATDLDAVRALILEYTESIGVDLSFQNLDHELSTLSTYYEAIWIADDQAGCVALRRIDDATCEMKRLYVRVSARGQGLGKALATHAIEEARRRGYLVMRLDTLPSMNQAMAMYESMGFRDIPPYRFNPIAGSRFMELPLE